MRFGLRLAVAVVAVVVTHAGAFVLIFWVPRYKKVWDDYGMRLSWSQAVLLDVSDFTARYWYALLPLTFLAATLFVALPLLRQRSGDVDHR